MPAKYVNCPSCQYVRCRNPKGCYACPLWQNAINPKNCYACHLWQNAILESVNGGVK